MRTPMKLALPQEDRSQLERWIKSRATPAKVKARARMVLMTADNHPTHEVMATLRDANKTLNLWRRRYLDEGLNGLLKGKTRPSRVPPPPTAKVQEVITLTLTGKPAHATYWSCRTPVPEDHRPL